MVRIAEAVDRVFSVTQFLKLIFSVKKNPNIIRFKILITNQFESLGL